MNLVDGAKREVEAVVQAAWARLLADGLYPADAELSGTVEIPRESSHGDYASTHAMVMAKVLKTAPMPIAQAIVDNIALEGTYVKSVSIAGAGFINFTLSDSWYTDVLEAVEKMGDSYGSSDIGAGKKVMVEFVSANPTGPMTIGNARGGVLGDTLASVLDRAGYDVWREFYINDTGNQVELFGKSIDARYMEICLGKGNYPFPEDGYHGEDIIDLAKLIYDVEGDSLKDLPEEERVEKCIAFGLPRNIALMKEHLERYRIHFDEWFPESSLYESGEVQKTVELLEKIGLMYEKDGAKWLKNTELGADKDEVLLRGSGFYTYYASDIAYHINKRERGFDIIIDVWGADHHGHSIRMGKTMEADALGESKCKIDFLIMQMVRLVRDGETVKVSKRTGKALTLNDLLDEISVDACRFFFNAKPDSHIEFDLGLAVRQDRENPVYYVQYAHARICTLLKALEGEGYKVPELIDIDVSLLASEAELDLIKQISLLPEEIKMAARDYDPSRINKYVVELAARFHKFYDSCTIRGEEESLLLARLKLADTTRAVIKNCLELLGITAPDRM
ncbi:MAG: arginine--tRNA ligase [Oscillospiraceae bacterium]|nr:arginine--tRNA ligase [Oscillospiraceae bacterium]